VTHRPQLDVMPELRAVVHAARIDVAYQPAKPDPATQHHWNATIQRAVTVIFEAALPDEATVAAAAADLLFMRGTHPDGTPPPPLGPTGWRTGWRYQQPDDAAPELQLIVQLSCMDDWGYAIAFTPLARWGVALERAERARRLRVELTWTPPHAPPVKVTIAFTPEDMPTEGLREFARDWRRQAHREDRLAIP
jgi:hypothetical protein